MYTDIHVKCCCYSCQKLIKLEFLDSYSKNFQIANLLKILPVGTELFHADGQTDRHDAAKRSFPNFSIAPINCTVLDCVEHLIYCISTADRNLRANSVSTETYEYVGDKCCLNLQGQHK
jgi:16S rRNA G1207 methylase RsmC